MPPSSGHLHFKHPALQFISMNWFRLFLITQILFNSLLVQNQPRRSPAAVSGSDIVAAVNVLRAQYGLPPYQLDGSLISMAQTQSEYQASIKKLTHTRANGSGPSVSSENIAEGTPGESADALPPSEAGC